MVPCKSVSVDGWRLWRRITLLTGFQNNPRAPSSTYCNMVIPTWVEGIGFLYTICKVSGLFVEWSARLPRSTQQAFWSAVAPTWCWNTCVYHLRMLVCFPFQQVLAISPLVHVPSPSPCCIDLFLRIFTITAGNVNAKWWVTTVAGRSHEFWSISTACCKRRSNEISCPIDCGPTKFSLSLNKWCTTSVKIESRGSAQIFCA